jgi:hypothetical protein
MKIRVSKKGINILAERQKRAEKRRKEQTKKKEEKIKAERISSYITSLINSETTMTILGEVHGELAKESVYDNLKRKYATQNIINVDKSGLFRIPTFDECGINVNVILIGMFGAGSYEIPGFFDTFTGGPPSSDNIQRIIKYIYKYPQIFGNIYHFKPGEFCLNLGQQGDAEERAAAAADAARPPQAFGQFAHIEMCDRQVRAANTGKPPRTCSRCGGFGGCRNTDVCYSQLSRTISNLHESGYIQSSNEQVKRALTLRKGGQVLHNLPDATKSIFLSDLVLSYIRELINARDGISTIPENLTIICTSCQVIDSTWFDHNTTALPTSLSDENGHPTYLIDGETLPEMSENFREILECVENARLNKTTNNTTKLDFYSPDPSGKLEQLKAIAIDNGVKAEDSDWEEQKIADTTWKSVREKTKLQSIFPGIENYYQQWYMTCFQIESLFEYQTYMEEYQDDEDKSTYFPFPPSTVPDYQKYLDAIRVVGMSAGSPTFPDIRRTIKKSRRKKRRKKRKKRKSRRKSRRNKKTKRKSKKRR